VRGIFVDPAGAPIYICGYTTSEDLPVSSDAYDKHKSDGDYYFAKLNFNGTKILYCTYYGGTGVEGEKPTEVPDWYNGIMDVAFPSRSIYCSSGTTSTCDIVPECKCSAGCTGGGYGDWDVFLTKFTDPCGNDEDPFEPNDIANTSVTKTPALAFPNAIAVTCDAMLSQSANDTVDYFQFKIPENAQPLTITLFQPAGVDFKVKLLDQNGSTVAIGNNNDVIDTAISVAGNYYIKVAAVGSLPGTQAGCYSLAVEAGKADDDHDGFSISHNDCNDHDAAVYPGATEICNNMDDNCDGLVDEAVEIYRYGDNLTGAVTSASPHLTAGSLIRVNGTGSASNSCATGFSSKSFLPDTLFNASLQAIEVSFTPMPDSHLDSVPSLPSCGETSLVPQGLDSPTAQIAVQPGSTRDWISLYLIPFVEQ
jgi:hypothetical protein